MTSEQWRQIDDTPYEVSDLGRVRRIGKRKALKLQPNHKGYLRAPLRINGKAVFRRVHRLVAAAFIGPPPSPLHHVNHKGTDGDLTNNRLDNLEYMTPAQNNKHAWDSGFQPRTRGTSPVCRRGHKRTKRNTRFSLSADRHGAYKMRPICLTCRAQKRIEKRELILDCQ